jgi:hypothetical protein
VSFLCVDGAVMCVDHTASTLTHNLPPTRVDGRRWNPFEYEIMVTFQTNLRTSIYPPKMVLCRLVLDSYINHK